MELEEHDRVDRYRIVINCSKLTTLPEFLYKIPEMQVLNIACSKGIEGTQLTEDWERLADPTQSESAKKNPDSLYEL